MHGVHTAIRCRVCVEIERKSPVEVDGVDQLGEGLHRAAVAAPEAVQGGTPTVGAVPLTLPGPEGQQVQQHSCNNAADVMHFCHICHTAVRGGPTNDCCPPCLPFPGDCHPESPIIHRPVAKCASVMSLSSHSADLRCATGVAPPLLHLLHMHLALAGMRFNYRLQWLLQMHIVVKTKSQTGHTRTYAEHSKRGLGP